MPAFGLALLGLVALVVIVTGQPVFVVLLLASVLGAAAGVVSGEVPLALLGALPSRLIGLLENDLLQAVPLFVLVGALLNRLPLAELLYRGGCRLAPRGAVAPRLSALGLSALLAPMNGSVGASVALLSRVVAPRLRDSGADPAETAALVSVASTLGVLVPPSIVLLLLGDAMMAAHTQALQGAGSGARVLNTQDLLHGVLLPALLVLASVGAIAAWQGRRSGARAAQVAPLAPREAAAVLASVGVIVTLLAGVAAGFFYPVEAAATGGVLLLAGAALAGQLDAARLKAVLRDAMDVTGSLFALFVAATTFTLVLRALGTDRWLQASFGRLAGGATATVAVALAVLLVCALVLDAFELIFVVVPILMPPVLARVADAQWVAVLSLLALQASFALPPLGYAVMMSSARIVPHPPARALARRLAPYLAALLLVLAAVFTWPTLVHAFDAPAAKAAPVVAPDEVERLMREAPRGAEQ